jgi:hypothetical protein
VDATRAFQLVRPSDVSPVVTAASAAAAAAACLTTSEGCNAGAATRMISSASSCVRNPEMANIRG